jgi:serine/threonine-protein kinase
LVVTNPGSSDETVMAAVQAAVVGRFVIERELGGGGMSRVFVGHERALDRRVVVKCLPPDALGGVSAERFAREVLLAARLQHPHIVPVLAAGEHDGLAWYAMPYVAGESLRARLNRGPLPIGDAINILRDVARALDYAHAQGVVHRDIKPENILLNGESATVADFGIAKALGGTLSKEGEAEGLTLTGTALGTPAYMAPEQVVADAQMDQRVDIYAWGCVAYEVITGRPPFLARTAREVLMAHLHETAPALDAGTPVPDGLASLIARCLEKDPDRRPARASELLSVLSTTTTPSGPRPAPTATKSPRRRMAGAAALVAIAGMAIAIMVRGCGEPASPSAGASGPLTVAVLPLANVAGDSTQEYFSDGMTDEIATTLAHVSGIRIAARSGSYRYKSRRDVDPRAVGRELGVGFLLQGSVRRSGSRIRISTQLTSTQDGVELWSESFDRDAGDVFKVQDDVAHAIVAALQRRLATGATPIASDEVAVAQGTTDSEAYDAYLQGMYRLQRRRPGLEGADEWFRRAIARDPNFARAHAQLGFTLAMLALFGDTPQAPRNAPALAEADRAISLDSTLADAYVARGLTYMYMRRADDASTALREAVRRNARSPLAHLHLGRFLYYAGHVHEALAEFKTAQSLDPYSAFITGWLGNAAYTAGDTALGLREAARAWALDSMALPVQATVLIVRVASGRLAEARAMLPLVQRKAFGLGLLGWAGARLGDTALANGVLREIDGRRRSSWHDELTAAYVFLGYGDTTRAFTAMERAVSRGEPLGTYDPLRVAMFDPVRQSAHFADIARRIGFSTLAVRDSAGQ